MPIEEQDFWYGFNLYRGMDERRVDSQVISMRESGWDYIGDNGYQSILHGFTFDTIEGKQLALTEIITDIDKFQQIVEETTQEEIVDISFLEDAWYLTDAGIRLIYYSNRLGDDELPYQEVTISYDAVEDIMQTKYIPKQEKNIVSLEFNEQYYFDYNEDGKKEEISIIDRKSVV